MPKETLSEPPVKPAVKRSLFNKPAWSDVQTSGDAVDFFSRSKQRYTDIVKEQDDRRRRKRNRLARQRGSGGDEVGEGEGGREGKRRRLEDISDDEEDDDDGSSGSGFDDDDEEQAKEEARRKAYVIALEDSDNDNSRPPPPPPDMREDSPQPQSRRHEPVGIVKKSTHTRAQETASVVPIEISDNEDVDQDVQIQPRPQMHVGDKLNVETSIQQSRQDLDPVSDEEYPELARLARERARPKQLETTFSHGPTSVLSPLSPTDSRPSPFGTTNFHLTSPPPGIPDAKISILITCRIEGTNPLIVQRKLSQPLKDVRLAWCTRQHFDQETTDSVFLTWRGKRLFDVTTCKSLGIGVDADGNIVTKGEKDALGEDNRQIHMEAMTQEIFDELRKVRETGGKFHHDTQSQIKEQETAMGESGAAALQQQQEKEQQIRVILKSKGHEDFKLIIKPTTRISRMQNAFRQARKVDPARDVFLMFDGEKLNPEDTVADTEISDMDHIDVHVK